MEQDVVLETTAVFGSFYFFSAAADAVTAADSAEMTAVSGSSYFFSAAADVAMAAADSAEMTVVSGLSYCSSSAEDAVIATMAADVTNAAKLNNCGETSTHRV